MPAMDGALIVDKPAEMSSHTVVVHVRRLVGTRRVGHTGTLDPFATGVLVVLVGKATRLLQFLSDTEKEYEAVIRFGHATDTGDRTGRRLPDPDQARRAHDLSETEVESAMNSLRGPIDQVPPMYSAKKVKGQKLYELARRGQQIERQAVRVNIDAFEIVEADGPRIIRNDDGTADLTVRVVCSAGTYVRTLAEDLGRKLGLGAHLTALRRTRAGRFKIESAITLDELEIVSRTNSIGDEIISLDAIIEHLPVIVLSETDVRRVRNGVNIEFDSAYQHGQRLRLQNIAGELVAVGIYDGERKIAHPYVVLGE